MGSSREHAHRVAEIVEQRLDRIDRDEEQPAPLVDTDRLQRPVGHVELGILTEPRRALQRSVEAVQPVVVRTLNCAAVPAAFLQQTGATMDAHVAERTKHSVVGTNCEDFGAGNLGGDVVAGGRDLRCRAEQLPRAPEDPFTFRLMSSGIEVEQRIEVANHATDRIGQAVAEAPCGTLSAQPNKSTAGISPATTANDVRARMTCSQVCLVHRRGYCGEILAAVIGDSIDETSPLCGQDDRCQAPVRRDAGASPGEPFAFQTIAQPRGSRWMDVERFGEITDRHHEGPCQHDQRAILRKCDVIHTCERACSDANQRSRGHQQSLGGGCSVVICLAHLMIDCSHGQESARMRDVKIQLWPHLSSRSQHYLCTHTTNADEHRPNHLKRRLFVSMARGVRHCESTFRGGTRTSY